MIYHYISGPLHLILGYGTREMVQQLITHGALPGYTSSVPCSRTMCLTIACNSGSRDPTPCSGLHRQQNVFVIHTHKHTDTHKIFPKQSIFVNNLWSLWNTSLFYFIILNYCNQNPKFLHQVISSYRHVEISRHLSSSRFSSKI